MIVNVASLCVNTADLATLVVNPDDVDAQTGTCCAFKSCWEACIYESDPLIPQYFLGKLGV